MEGVIATDGAVADNGHGALHWQILWAKVRILRYVMQHQAWIAAWLTMQAGRSSWNGNIQSRSSSQTRRRSRQQELLKQQQHYSTPESKSIYSIGV